MSLFNQVLSAINEPSKQANTSQLSQIINMIEQVSQVGDVNHQQTQVITSILGKYVRSSLKERQQNGGIEQKFVRSPHIQSLI